MGKGSVERGRQVGGESTVSLEAVIAAMSFCWSGRSCSEPWPLRACLVAVALEMMSSG